MAVNSGWVGSSAKAETGKAWMSEARTVLRLSPSGWMSEMIGKSKEIRFINNTNRTQASIYDLMGRPTAVTDYYFENNATISAATQGGWALQTGSFPAGSTLTIINRGFIRGGGGNSTNRAGQKGGDALILNLPTQLDNSQGYIYGGGGGGGTIQSYNVFVSGGGGAGTPAGIAVKGFVTGANGTATKGGAGGAAVKHKGGAGGDLGQAGTSSSSVTLATHAGGAAGRAVVRNGHALTWLGGKDSTRVKGPVV